MDTQKAATGGPGLRQAWEQLRLKPGELAAAIGVSRAALYKWAGDGASTPTNKVEAVSTQLRERASCVERERVELLRHLEQAAASGQGPTRTELRRKGLGAAGEALLDDLLDGALPLAHVRQVVKVDELGRTYVRKELHPGPAEDHVDVDEIEVTVHILRGLRLYADWSLAGTAQRIGCRPEQLHAWESGREDVPAGRLPKVRAALARACASRTLREVRDEARMSSSELARAAGMSPALLKNAEYGHRRALAPAELAEVGHALDRRRRDAADRLEADAGQILEVIATSEPHGLTRNQLRLRLGERRTDRGPAGGVSITERTDKALEHLHDTRRIEWGATDHVRGGHNALPRLHLAGLGHRYDSLTAADVQSRLDAAGASRQQLAKRIGLHPSSVGEWMRGERDIPPPRAADVLRALDELDQARPNIPAQIFAGATESPGLTSRQLAVRVGYGKNSAAVAAALEDLIAAGQLHRRPRPRGFGIYSGPAPAPVEPLPATELKRARQQAGLRQRDLAKALGLTQTAVARWERDGLPAHRRTTVETLLRPTA